jgi:hypothetical protein
VGWRDANPPRDGDRPAWVRADGTSQWYRDGKCHRDGDKPAVEYASGSKAWYRDGKCHRDNDLPAYVSADGSKMWYRNDQVHRDDGMPAVENADGTYEWYTNGVKHAKPTPRSIRSTAVAGATTTTTNDAQQTTAAASSAVTTDRDFDAIPAVGLATIWTVFKKSLEDAIARKDTAASFNLRACLIPWLKMRIAAIYDMSEITIVTTNSSVNTTAASDWKTLHLSWAKA